MTSAGFITLEGGEGAGKSTQCQHLAAALRSAGLPVVETREPGGSEAAEQIRELLVHGAVGRWDPLTEALLHNAARREHIQTTIRPALDAGAWVICDRFVDSTMAYQGYGHGLGQAPIEALAKLVVESLRPDLTVILDLPVAEGLRRAAGRAGGGDRYERMDLAFHERIRDGFREIAAAAPDRCLVIDATASEAAVRAAIRDAVVERLGVVLP